jgi:hypothetical protein
VRLPQNAEQLALAACRPPATDRITFELVQQRRHCPDEAKQLFGKVVVKPAGRDCVTSQHAPGPQGVTTIARQQLRAPANDPV